MTMDWDDYKNFEQSFTVKSFNHYIDRLETLDSPIERIAGLIMHRLHTWLGIYNTKIAWQKQIGKYRVDFLITHKNPGTKAVKMVVIECDGHDFHERTKAQVKRDKARDRFFVKQGYLVLRYSGSEICESPQKIFEDVSMIICPDEFKEIFPEPATELTSVSS